MNYKVGDFVKLKLRPAKYGIDDDFLLQYQDQVVEIDYVYADMHTGEPFLYSVIRHVDGGGFLDNIEVFPDEIAYKVNSWVVRK